MQLLFSFFSCRSDARFGAPSRIINLWHRFWSLLINSWHVVDETTCFAGKTSEKVFVMKIPDACCWVTDYSPALSMLCLARRVARVALTWCTDVLHLLHPAAGMGWSLPPPLPPLPLTISPRIPLPQRPPPLSRLVSLAQASPLTAEVCADTVGVHHARLLGDGRGVRGSSCGRPRTHARAQRETSTGKSS